MSEFRILEHTADVGFEAFGATREQMFSNAGRALVFLITDPETLRESDTTSIQLKSGDPAGLLVDWLSEILYLYDAENWLFRDFEIERLTDLSISAAGRGERFDPARHQIKLLVKAITYHQLAVEQTANGWRCRVYVDI
jgi:SHS2 domain-containing protein